MLRSILVGICSVVLVACSSKNFVHEPGTTSFYFAEAQPSGVVNDNTFSQDFQGTYKSVKDTTVRLIITENTIYTEFPVLFSVTQAALDTTPDMFIKDGQLHGLIEDQTLTAEEENDTFYIVYPNRSDVFRIGTDEKLRKLDSKYLLNYKEDSGLWSTLLLYIDAEGVLKMESLDHDPVMEELQKFEELTRKKMDPLDTYVANPTQAEFRVFVEAGAFRDAEVYRKLQ